MVFEGFSAGANPLFANADIAVVGGDSAVEEALYLTKYARQVHLLVRRDRLRASQTMQDRVFNHTQIQIHWQIFQETLLVSGCSIKDD